MSFFWGKGEEWSWTLKRFFGGMGGRDGPEPQKIVLGVLGGGCPTPNMRVLGAWGSRTLKNSFFLLVQVEVVPDPKK